MRIKRIASALMLTGFIAATPNITLADEATITIKRDLYGTPHIFAEDTYSLFYGMGYALAEDRLFQWEMLRRMGRGTAAEVLGEEYLEADKNARADYDPKAIEAQIKALSPDDRAILSGYTDGYNARLHEVLANPEALLPKTFTDFGFLPTPISELDVLGVFIRTIATNFSDANEEINNYALLTELRKMHGAERGQAIFEQLRWINDPTATTTIKAEDQVEHQLPEIEVELWNNGLAPISASALKENLKTPLAAAPTFGPNTHPIASNLWIFAPEKTDFNQAVFMNGPQYGNFRPGNPFGIALHGAGWESVGASSWGLPHLNWGTNGDIGWGVTIGGGDTTDIFQVHIREHEGAIQYRYQDAWHDFELRTETIKVKERAPVTVEFYQTPFGEVQLFDNAEKTAYIKRRSWHNKEVASFISWVRLSQATHWDELLETGRDMALNMNWYYIDKTQNIGHVFLGDFPIKSHRLDPRIPIPLEGEHGWEGTLAFEQLPKVLNPSTHYILNWNNKPQPNWNNADATLWGAMDRIDVIEDYVNARDTLSLEEIKALNPYASYQNVYFNYFKPYFAELAKREDLTEQQQSALAEILAWDGQMLDTTHDRRYDAVGYTLFKTWLTTALESFYTAIIPEPFLKDFTYMDEGRTSMGAMILYNALRGEESSVPQTVDLLNIDAESFADAEGFILENLAQTLTHLEHEMGSDMALWKLPIRPHQFMTVTFGNVPVNSKEQGTAIDLAMNRGTSSHLITFNADGVEYRDVLPPGQSGFIAPDGTLDPHYSDQLELYKDFNYKQGWLKESELNQHLESEKELTIPAKRTATLNESKPKEEQETQETQEAQEVLQDAAQ